jgi:hypothetical protein
MPALLVLLALSLTAGVGSRAGRVAAGAMVTLAMVDRA